MDEWGRPDTVDEVEALIARLPRADDPYDVARTIMQGATSITDACEYWAELYLLWACFTDWVEAEDDGAEAIDAMRQAASQWGGVKDREEARAVYFDHWMFDVMDVSHALPEDWTIAIDEVSAGVYRVTAKASDGRSVSVCGSNRMALTSEVGQRVEEIARERTV